MGRVMDESTPEDRAAAVPLLERVRREARLRRLSLRTETAYLGWVRRYVALPRPPPPARARRRGDRRLPHPPRRRRSAVSASTQNQALAAILFLYREVLGARPRRRCRERRPRPPAETAADGAVARRGPRACSRELERPGGAGRDAPLRRRPAPARGAPPARAGPRLRRAARSSVRDGQGRPGPQDDAPGDRRAGAPRPPRRASRALHRQDLARGHGRVWLPDASTASSRARRTDWSWQWVFPAPEALDRSAHGRRPAATTSTGADPARRRRGRDARRHRQARHLPHPPPQLRHPPARSRLRHPHRPGAPRPPRRHAPP